MVAAAFLEAWEDPKVPGKGHSHKIEKAVSLHRKKTHFLMSTFFWSLLYWSDQTSTVASIAAAFLKAGEDPKVPGKGWHSHKFDKNTFNDLYKRKMFHR